MEPGGNSGMFLWSDAKPEGNRLPCGMEVQMLELDWVNQHKHRDGTLPPIAYVHGELFGAGGMTATPDNPRGSRSKSLEIAARVWGNGIVTFLLLLMEW